MRTCSALSGLALLTAVGLSGPAGAFDVRNLQNETPAGAFRYGFDAYRQGDMTTAFEALEYAAANGHPMAQWKLGRMYAAGDGIARDDLKAFALFSEVADAHADESPNAPSARFVSSAFVALGAYYRDGIPNGLRPDFGRARQLFEYAASYFGDADAQLSLAMMYYEGEGGDPNPRQAARWAKLSADKGNAEAQALLGHLLFEGEGVRRQPVLGLMFLSIARERSDTRDAWIWDMHEQAFAVASESERRTAVALAAEWLEKNQPATQ